MLLALPLQAALVGLTASVSLQSGQPANIRPGETTVLEITLGNNNPLADITSTAFNNSLPGVLPDGLKVDGVYSYTCFDPEADRLAPGTGTIAGSGTLTAVDGTQAITLADGVIPHRDDFSATDGTCTIRIPVTAGTADGAATDYTYTIADGAVTGDDGAAVANVGNVGQTVNVLALTRPTITTSFSNSVAILGGSARTLTIRVTNPDSVPLEDVDITDTFPTQGGGGAIIQVANPPNVTYDCPGGTDPVTAAASGDTSVTFTGGTVAASSTCEMTIDIEARHTDGAYQTSSQTNRIDRSTDVDNDIGIRAESDATANIRARSPLSITKSFSPQFPEPWPDGQHDHYADQQWRFGPHPGQSV